MDKKPGEENKTASAEGSSPSTADKNKNERIRHLILGVRAQRVKTLSSSERAPRRPSFFGSPKKPSPKNIGDEPK